MSDESVEKLCYCAVVIALIACALACILTGHGEYAFWFGVAIFWLMLL